MSTNIRAALAADPSVGAGNVLPSLIRHGASLDGPGLSFDTQVDSYEPWYPMTLGELADRVRARSAWLVARGVKPRDPIGVWVTSAADVMLNYLALNWIGAIPALLNGNVSAEIADAWMSKVRAEGILADADHVALLAGTGLTIPILGDVAELGSASPADAPAPYRHAGNDPVSITHSSGTTGAVPKPIGHSSETLFASTRRLRLSVPRAQGTERILSALPAAHTAGILAVNQALGNRSELLFLSSQMGPVVLDAIERWHPSGVFGFSVTWAQLARYDLTKRDMDSVALWFNTGDAAHEAHIRKLVAVGSHKTVTRQGVVTVAGSTFVDGLGSTEMGHSAFHIGHRVDTARYHRCIGIPHLFADVAVLNRDGTPVPVGQVGHLGLKSPTLMLGYWNDSNATYRDYVAGYYLTGDLVYQDEEGYYYHMDRTVDSIELGGGKWIHTALSEERILRDCPDISDCTVLAVRDGDAVVTDVMLMLVEGAEPDDPTRESRVIAALDENVAPTVRKVVVVDGDDLPTGATGKIRKLVLRQRYAAEPDAPARPAGLAS